MELDNEKTESRVNKHENKEIKKVDKSHEFILQHKSETHSHEDMEAVLSTRKRE